MNATKEQERKALEKIKKIVDELGENSYVATAFKGCFEIAEQNIEYDFADSLQERLEITEKRLKSDNEQLKAANNEIDQLKDQVTNYQSKALSKDDLMDIESLIEDKFVNIKKEIQNQSAMIVSLAESPESEAFKQAVKSHRAALDSLRFCENLKSRIHNSY